MLTINRNIAAPANNFFTSTVNTATTAAARATAALGDGSVITDPTTTPAAPRSASGVLDKLSIFGQLRNFIGGKIADGISGIGSFFKSVGSTAGQVSRFLGNKIADGASKVGGFFKNVGAGFVDFFKNPIDRLKSFGSGIKALGGKVMDAGMWAGGKLGDGFMAFMKGGAWVAGKMREGVVGAAKAVGGFFKNVGAGFVDFFKNPIDRLKSFGSGIKALGGKVMDAGMWAGGKLGDGFMAFMKGGAWVAGKMREGVVGAAQAVGGAVKAVGKFIGGLF